MGKKTGKRNNRHRNAVAKTQSKLQPQGQSVTTQMTETLIEQTASVYSGPIPHPDEFDQYNQVLPGAADRILAMAENFGEHDRDMTSRALALDEFVELSKSTARTRGQWMAFLLLLTFSGIAAIGAVLDHPEVFKMFSGASFVGLAIIVAAFMGADKIKIPKINNQKELATEPENDQ